MKSLKFDFYLWCLGDCISFAIRLSALLLYKLNHCTISYDMEYIWYVFRYKLEALTFLYTSTYNIIQLLTILYKCLQRDDKFSCTINVQYVQLRLHHVFLEMHLRNFSFCILRYDGV